MKKIILSILICFTALLQANSFNDKDATRVVYYSTVEFVETPLSYIKGSVPLTKEVALKRNHYRFSYDLQNRLTSIAFYNGTAPRHPNHTANLFTLAHRMEFFYENDLEKVRFFDTKGKRTTVLGNCSEFVFKLNKLGFRESLYFLDDSGNRVENSWDIFEYKWEYLSDGTVIEDRFNKNGKQASIRPGFEFYRLKLYFNTLGHIALMQNIDNEGNLVENSSGASQDNITTNAEGNFLQWQVLDNNHQLEKGNGPDVAVGIQQFNKYGYESGLEHRDENNNLMYSAYGICKSKTQFDEFGNISERTFYNDANQPSNHKNAGYHKLKIKWDKSGNYRELLSYFNVNDKPTVHATRGYHSVKYHYHRNKNLSRIDYLDVSGELVNRKDNGVAYITYQYKNGEQASMLRFNKEGKKL
ncbi:hypothetical protein [Pontimicrobium aquaticum]|uniref:Antitoxin component YwqK of the YwqJK toxin-antitoxin module n=1 Tax=Pontimicrobium aquaticum TaxID=2565367 RepID=A0A4U0EWE5_9FLAO|nr:hypothetical protein [Pontimicrobium aquaticum]TJY36256.1 hypothetical protein E5167_06200 [Pontimicrobium aquaticum]